MRKILLFVIVALSVTGYSVSCAQDAGKDKAFSTELLVKSLNQKLDEIYIFPEKTQLISSYLNSQLKNGVYRRITDKKALATKLYNDMQSVHHDGHLSISYDPNFARDLLKPQPPGQDIADS